jgi:hypothetical protein
VEGTLRGSERFDCGNLRRSIHRTRPAPKLILCFSCSLVIQNKSNANTHHIFCFVYVTADC